MEIPVFIRQKIERLVEAIPLDELKKASQNLTRNYKFETGRGKSLVNSETEAVTYAAVRFPATFCATYKVLSWLPPEALNRITSCNDFGAGSGASALACLENMENLTTVRAVERDRLMIDVGRELLSDFADRIVWENRDVSVRSENKKTDMVIASYVLNEIDGNSRKNFYENLWNSTEDLVVVIEPGTPTGFANIKEARKYFLDKNMHIWAPCPHEKVCRIPESDWCHFTCRVPRTKLHLAIKQAEVAYEDEKFSYVVLSKNLTKPVGQRILRHPQIASGKVNLTLCTPDGITTSLITRSNPLFKAARKSDCGDGWGGRETDD